MKALPIDHGAEVGERMRRARKAAGFTQVEAARRVGTAVSQLARVECGREHADETLLVSLANVLAVGVEWLRSGRDDGKSAPTRPRLTGVEVRRIRRELELDREELADRIGVKASTLHNVELGHQQLGPAASASIQNLQKSGRQVIHGRPDDATIDRLVGQAIVETVRLLSDETAMKAVGSLTKALGDSEIDVISRLVRGKLRSR